MDTLVDSNVIIDLLSPSSEWKTWSETQAASCLRRGRLIINPIIYAEVSIGFSDAKALDEAVPESLLRRDALPWEAAFLAASAFGKYRKQGGTKTGTLPDFFIGAHAAVTGMSLLTRDSSRYRAYFPQVQLITP